MYKVQIKNAISDVIYETLKGEKYSVSDDCKDPDAILVRSASLHNMELPDSLCAIARAGAGYNNIPVAACTEAGIAVFNTPGANANAVKESVLTGLLLATRDVVGGIEWARTLEGKGEKIAEMVEKGKKQFIGPELMGKKLAVMGLGAVGGLVANTAPHLGMDVVGYDPFLSVDAAWSLSRAVHHATSYEELLSDADYLSIHIPLTPSTKGMIQSDIIEKMKRGSVILNFSRGEVVDDNAVIEALQSGQIRKYITDFPNQQLLNVGGVLSIPHLGASTPESEENCAVMAAQELQAYLSIGSISNSINLPRCELLPPEGHRICVIHKNVPNMIAQIAATMASNDVNIPNMTNKSRADIAYTVLDIPVPVTEKVKKMLSEIDGVLRVRVVN